MSGTITHEWSGSILTVVSDSGASSADLKGPKGDTGPRGPQGPAGIIYDAAGKVVVDLGPYATMEYVDAAVDSVEVDMSPYPTKAEVSNTYATKNYVSTEIAKAQLEGAGVDTSGFVTKDDLGDLAVDNKTIIKGTDGTLRTAVGGYLQEGSVFYKATSLYYIPKHWMSSGSTPTEGPLCNIGTAFVEGTYHIIVTFEDGFVEERDIAITDEDGDGTFVWNEYANGGQPQRLSMFSGTSTGNIYIQTDSVDCVIVGIEINRGSCVPMDAIFIPVDGSTIYVNDDGKLACAISIGEDGTLDLSNYYTKAEIDALIASGGANLPSSEEVSY